MAPSKESESLRELFLILAAQFPSDGNPFGERATYDQVYKAATECPGVTYESIKSAGGRPALLITPAGTSFKNGAMLYMHGGGFSFGSPYNSHRRLTAHLAKSCGVPALSIDYRLTPEVSYPIPLEDCINAYKYLLEEMKVPSEKIVVAGDSCGGGLSASLPLAAIQQGFPIPGASVSLSPLYDLTNSGASFQFNDEFDVLNGKEFVNMLAERYTNGNRELRKDPLVSPLFADEKDLKRLPPTWISASGYDMLLDDARGFTEKVRQAGGKEVVLEVQEGQQHVMEFMVGNAPEADESVRKIGEWVRKKLNV